METGIDILAFFKHHTPPMPLKHFTETFLVVVLGAMTVLAGLLTATLPNLPDGALPWALLFVLSVVYPLSLYGLFQRRRADNLFRNLHWFPALILLVWLILQGVAMQGSLDWEAAELYTWGWTLGPVVLGFILIVMFCLKVIRRRVPRLTLLAFILIPFAAAAFMSEREGHWEQEITAALWTADFWKLDDSGLLASWMTGQTQTGVNLEQSDDPTEEKWRERLRMRERREERIASRVDDEDDGKMASSSSSDGAEFASVSSKPTKLPDSGFGWSGIILLLIAGYTAALHDRARRRA